TTTKGANDPRHARRSSKIARSTASSTAAAAKANKSGVSDIDALGKRGNAGSGCGGYSQTNNRTLRRPANGRKVFCAQFRMTSRRGGETKSTEFASLDRH